MPMSCGELSPGNTTDVLFTAVTADDEALTGATCRVWVLSGAYTFVYGLPVGTAVANGDAIVGTELEAGSYKAILPSNLAITVGNTYEVVGVINKSGVGSANWNESKAAKLRKGGAGC